MALHRWRAPLGACRRGGALASALCVRQRRHRGASPGRGCSNALFDSCLRNAQNGTVLVMGGCGSEQTGVAYNDVWASSDGGAAWTPIRSTSPWAPRMGHAAVVMLVSATEASRRSGRSPSVFRASPERVSFINGRGSGDPEQQRRNQYLPRRCSARTLQLRGRLDICRWRGIVVSCIVCSTVGPTQQSHRDDLNRPCARCPSRGTPLRHHVHAAASVTERHDSADRGASRSSHPSVVGGRVEV